MARVHFLTVGEGDCTIIEHNSGRVTMIDICGGNEIILKAEAKRFEALERPRGNFAMCKRPTNPVEYLRVHGIKRIFRFILTHPDMDHLGTC
jgi:competence protein ComEC